MTHATAGCYGQDIFFFFFAVVSRTANSYLRIRDVEGFCDNVSSQKKETVQTGRQGRESLEVVRKVLKCNSL